MAVRGESRGSNWFGKESGGFEGENTGAAESVATPKAGMGRLRERLPTEKTIRLHRHGWLSARV